MTLVELLPNQNPFFSYTFSGIYFFKQKHLEIVTEELYPRENLYVIDH